jgi:magnesium-transporting ATPase (P-type)
MHEPAMPWHALAPAEAIAALDSGPGGLSAAEASRRLGAYGPNRLKPPPKRGPLRRFVAQFHNLLIYVLVMAAVITALLGQWVDTWVIVAVVIVNAAIGFTQEGKAEAALDAIRQMLSLRATAVRDGRRLEIPADELVPGDVVVLQSGDKVPADVRLVYVKSLRVEEAALTGESVPVEKAADPVAADAPVGDRAAMAFSGTLVTYGYARGVVVTTGDATEIGRIGRLLAEVEPLATPLLRQIARFAKGLTVAILALGAFTFAVGTFARDYAAAEMFMAVVGIVVAAIPEGLPAILTITLAIGVQTMARQNAIVRRLPAVEALGSVTVICTDKTGTLTKNEMTVRSIATARHRYEVGGVGYDPHGGFSLDGRDVVPEQRPLLAEMCRAALLCNDAALRRAGEAWIVDGDPTEGALLVVAAKAGLDLRLVNEEFPRTDAIPFESEHRFMATLHHDHAGRGFVYLKGAPERVLEMCSRQRTLDGDAPLDRAYWHRRIEEIAARGERLLAVAGKPARAGQRELRFADVEDGLTFLGLFGLIDPPREEAIAAIAECRSAGIRVKMITGDHALTARAIAGQLGLVNDRDVVTGQDLDTIAEEKLVPLARDVDVFARASPEHKLRLVQALQAGGAVVAMTGDGVNDAPALKRADVGVAMGRKGTEAAKEAAEMVLVDDNFASIARAVKEGRVVYDNLKKAIMFALPTNGGEAFTIIIAVLLGHALPITPAQILWVNTITAVTLALALAFEPAENEVMRRPPRHLQEPILSRFLTWRIVFVSVLFVAGTFALFEWAERSGRPIEESRTVAVNTLVFLEVFYLFNVRYLTAPSLTRQGILGTRAVLIAVGLVAAAQALFTYAPFMQTFFGTRPLGMIDAVAVFAVGAAVFAAVEIEKWIVRRLALTARRPTAR